MPHLSTVLLVTYAILWILVLTLAITVLATLRHLAVIEVRRRLGVHSPGRQEDLNPSGPGTLISLGQHLSRRSALGWIGTGAAMLVATALPAVGLAAPNVPLTPYCVYCYGPCVGPGQQSCIAAQSCCTYLGQCCGAGCSTCGSTSCQHVSEVCTAGTCSQLTQSCSC